MLAAVSANPTSRWHDDTRYTVVMLDSPCDGAARLQQLARAASRTRGSRASRDSMLDRGSKCVVGGASARARECKISKVT